METPLDVLQLSNAATQQEIDQAYLRLISALVEEQRLQPERRIELNLRLGAISQAYQVLVNGKKGVSVEGASWSRSGDSFDVLQGIAKRPVIYALLSTIPLLLLIYVMTDSVSRIVEVNAERAALNSALEVEKTASETERLRELEIIALENKRLKQEMEIATREQERRTTELEHRIASQRKQLDVMAEEQQRRERALEYHAIQEATALKLQERETQLAEQEADIERRRRQDAHNDHRVQTNVDDIYRTIDIMRDTQAARLGISRALYDHMVENRNDYGKE